MLMTDLAGKVEIYILDSCDKDEQFTHFARRIRHPENFNKESAPWSPENLQR